MNMQEKVLDYWFGPISEQSAVPKENAMRWFMKNPAVDQEIEDVFFQTLLSAEKGELDHWKETPEGWLALIIVLDQFSRNIYRGTSDAFACDEKALSLSMDGIDAGIDKKLLPIHRVFFYMPLQHSEEIYVQKKSVVCFYQLSKEVPTHLQDNFSSFHKYAIAHHDAIDKFGRFPHRNPFLGRDSTEEELIFLEETGGF